MIDTIIIPSIVHESEITKTQEVEEKKIRTYGDKNTGRISR